MESALVAFSGGVDSSLLLKTVHKLLGDRSAGVIVLSPTLPESELDDARELARKEGWQLHEMESSEMDLPRFTANTKERCYFCKDHRYQKLNQFAAEHGYSHVLDGGNADDLGDFRPGQRAAAEHGVRSPLQEAGLTKSEIRSLARGMGLPNWKKPSSACLASRIPYGTPITVGLLNQVGKAEGALSGLGFSQLRVRHHGQVARIEVPVDEFEFIIAKREAIIQALRNCGYDYVSLDLEGFRSGSMNKGISTNG